MFNVFLSKFKNHNNKVRVKKYLSNDFFEMNKQMTKTEKIINVYGKSITDNAGNLVYRESTLKNSRKEIEVAFKTYVEYIVWTDYPIDDIKNMLIDTYGSLSLFINDNKANYINLEYLKHKKGSNDEIFKDIMKEIGVLNSKKLTRMVYFTEYIDILRNK